MQNININRIVGLDILRTFAILFVIIHHFRELPNSPLWIQWLGLRGYIGVDIFFVLSGYLIVGGLLREHKKTGTVNIPKFWIKRWFRIFPAYFVVLFLLAGMGAVNAKSLPSMLIFIQNYTNSLEWIVTWSLCIEEHFYLIVPIFLYLLYKLKLSNNQIIILFCLLFATPLILRFFFYNPAMSYKTYLSDFYPVTHLHFDGLVMGSLFAYIKETLPGVWNNLVKYKGYLCLLGLLIFINSVYNPYLTGFGTQGIERVSAFPAIYQFSLVSVGTALMLPWGSNFHFKNNLINNFFVFIAERSYSMYLIHVHIMLFAMLFTLALTDNFYIHFFVSFVLTLLLSNVLYKKVELFFLARRERFWQKLTHLCGGKNCEEKT